MVRVVICGKMFLGKGKEVDLYSAYRQYNSTTKRSDVDHTELPACKYATSACGRRNHTELTERDGVGKRAGDFHFPSNECDRGDRSQALRSEIPRFSGPL